MTRWSVTAFAVLVAATFAAFFVASRLKNEPTVIQDLQVNTGGAGRVFSPNGDGRRERVRVGLRLKDDDHVTLTWIDANGDDVRTIVDDQALPAYRRLWGVPWDGTDEDGREVPDGRYRVRITLRDQGRSVISPWSVLKDTRPPRPEISSIGPQRQVTGPAPELLPEPDGAAVRINLATPAVGRDAVIRLFRTAPGAVREVLTLPIAPGAKRVLWDGLLPDGRRPSAGTYLAVAEWRDVAGNRGTSVPLGRDGLPILGRGPLPGNGGITVRYLAARPPVTPAKARDPVLIDVDARAEPFQWELRRLGTAIARNGSSRTRTRPRVRFQAPGGKSGVYVFAVHTAARRTQVLLPVQARNPVAGTAARPRGVLVVLPTITWQGRNPVDDDGDGAPDTLDRGGPARFFRFMAGDGLPQGFTEHEAPVLQWLDRTGRRYDITTDLALALGRGPRLTGHQGVLIPGDSRWLPSTVRANLRTFARRGGTVVSLGTDSLRRTVRLEAETLTRPSPPLATDVFGARLKPLATTTTDVESFQDDPAVGLFEGADGLFAAVPAWEATEGAGTDADIVSRAVTADPPGRNVIVAVRYQDGGLVIRTGFPAFATRLSTDDPAVTALMARMWTLLSR